MGPGICMSNEFLGAGGTTGSGIRLCESLVSGILLMP